MKELLLKIRQFVNKRDWKKYHSPKNLAIGLSVEAAELLEIFTWLSEEESYNLNENQLNHIKEEIGDIMIYLTNLADKFGFNPIDCALEKLKLNENKYPVDLVKGSAKKYTEYE